MVGETSKKKKINKRKKKSGRTSKNDCSSKLKKNLKDLVTLFKNSSSIEENEDNGAEYQIG